MSDALERLKQRSRPTVPNRDASLSPALSTLPTPDTSTSRNLETEIPSTQEPSTPIATNIQTPAQPALQKPASLEIEEPLKTKQSTLRLEQGMSDRLQEICRTHGICREVLIEAMFEYCESYPEAMQTALAEAQVKNERRQQLANLKRAQSMMQRFSQPG
jgi:hypothetical protein